MDNGIYNLEDNSLVSCKPTHYGQVAAIALAFGMAAGAVLFSLAKRAYTSFTQRGVWVSGYATPTYLSNFDIPLDELPNVELGMGQAPDEIDEQPLRNSCFTDSRETIGAESMNTIV